MDGLRLWANSLHTIERIAPASFPSPIPAASLNLRRFGVRATLLLHQIRIMIPRVYRTVGALTLLCIWTFAPVGGLLGSSEALLRFLTAIGLLAGASAGWLMQHTRHRPMTRSALTGAGWIASVVLFVVLLRDSIPGPAALAHASLIVAYSGSLAWGLRLLLPPVQPDRSNHEGTRNLLVDIKTIEHGADVEVAPRFIGGRITPTAKLVPGSVERDPSPAKSRNGKQKIG